METGGTAEHVLWGLDWRKQRHMRKKTKLMHKIQSKLDRNYIFTEFFEE